MATKLDNITEKVNLDSLPLELADSISYPIKMWAEVEGKESEKEKGRK